MNTEFKTMKIHYIVKRLKATYTRVFDAMNALGIRGKVVRGERLYTNEEFGRVRDYLAGNER